MEQKHIKESLREKLALMNNPIKPKLNNEPEAKSNSDEIFDDKDCKAYSRPRGRTPKGKKWDKTNGVYISKETSNQ
jgi:hypothetical protein